MTSSTVSSLNGRSRSSASAAPTISASATSGVRLRRRPPASTPPTLTIGKRTRYTNFPSHAGAIQSPTTCRRSSVVEHRTFNPLWSQVRILPPASATLAQGARSQGVPRAARKAPLPSELPGAEGRFLRLRDQSPCQGVGGLGEQQGGG